MPTLAPPPLPQQLPKCIRRNCRIIAGHPDEVCATRQSVTDADVAASVARFAPLCNTVMSG
jgi:hypothetical protein